MKGSEKTMEMSSLLRCVQLCVGILAVTVFLYAPSMHARQWHIATNGTENPSGTLSRPWSIHFGLGGAERSVGPGDTVWLHGGVYTSSQGFFTDLIGTPGQYCLVKPWQGERVIFRVSDGPAVAVFAVYGSYTMYMDIEFDCAVTNTGQIVDGVWFYEEKPGVPGGGRGNKLINCIIHNATNSGIADQDAEGTELYGNIVYYSGRRTSGGNAYAVYAQNHFPTRKQYEHNVFLTTFAEYVLHMYGTDVAVDNFTLRENVILNAVGSARLMFSSGAHDPEGVVIERNFWWGRSAGEVILQERKGMESPVYRENIFARGRLSFRSSTIARTFEQNLVWGSQPEETTSGVPGSVPFQTSQHPNNDWQINQPSLDLNRVFVLPNKYEAGRALVVAYNSSGQSSVSVNLANVVAQGALYEIRDAQNIPGSPVLSGTYRGGAVDVPMTSTTVPSPVTQHPQFPAPSHTGREFGVFIVRSSGGAISPPVHVAEEQSPVSFSLEQNYPNPFNPSTILSFVIPKTENVSLVVYDLLGHEVARPVEKTLTAGRYTVPFTAGELAAGVYYVRLTAGVFSATRRMVLIR